VKLPALPCRSGTTSTLCCPIGNIDWFTPIAACAAVITIKVPGIPGLPPPMPGVAVTTWVPPCVTWTARYCVDWGPNARTVVANAG
jgi:hypothetical protein